MNIVRAEKEISQCQPQLPIGANAARPTANTIGAQSKIVLTKCSYRCGISERVQSNSVSARSARSRQQHLQLLDPAGGALLSHLDTAVEVQSQQTCSPVRPVRSPDKDQDRGLWSLTHLFAVLTGSTGARHTSNPMTRRRERCSVRDHAQTQVAKPWPLGLGRGINGFPKLLQTLCCIEG